MSCTRTVKTFETVEVKIECCDKTEIENLEKTIISSIEQKLEKLNILIQNCSVYNFSGALLIQDRYNICSDIISVAEAFGLKIKQIDCPLKGKTYIITDDLLKVLKQFDKHYVFGHNVSNQELTESIRDIIASNLPSIEINESILEIVKNIKNNGQYTLTKAREITEEYYDGSLRSRQEGKWDSDETEIRSQLMKISKEAQNTVNKTNEQLRDGTTKLIYSRARQMGYAVQEIKKGTQTQLVLVRCE